MGRSMGRRERLLRPRCGGATGGSSVRRTTEQRALTHSACPPSRCLSSRPTSGSLAACCRPTYLRAASYLARSTSPSTAIAASCCAWRSMWARGCSPRLTAARSCRAPLSACAPRGNERTHGAREPLPCVHPAEVLRACVPMLPLRMCAQARRATAAQRQARPMHGGRRHAATRVWHALAPLARHALRGGGDVRAPAALVEALDARLAWQHTRCQVGRVEQPERGHRRRDRLVLRVRSQVVPRLWLGGALFDLERVVHRSPHTPARGAVVRREQHARRQGGGRAL